MMTLWRGQIRYTVPMLFCLAWFFNFLIGGLSGVFLSDVPSDVTTHGSFFSMAHFHYTIVGGLVFTFFAAIYYWVPKMTGFQLNERMGKIHFWWMFIAFNSTFAPLFAAGFLGMPRRVVTYPASLQFINDLGVGLGVPPRRVDAVLPRQLRLLAAVRAGPGGRQPVELEVDRVAAAVAGAGPQLRPRSRSSRATRTATASPRARSRFRQAHRQGGTDVSELAHPATEYEIVESEPPEVLARNLVTAGHLLASATAFFFLAFVFALLLSPLAEQPRHVAAEGHRPVRRLGNRDHRVRRRERGADAARARATIAPTGGRSGA